MTLTAGRFNKYGKVYKLSSTATVDSGGQVDESNPDNWQLVGPRHFNIVPVSSREFMLGDQLQANVTHQLTTNYDSQSKEFSEKYKFVYAGRTFNFAGRGLNVEEKNRWLAFPASEVGA